MQTLRHAARAYENASAHRTVREQEADVFYRVNGALRAARAAGPAPRVRAVADNRRLWITVIDLLRDATNALPAELRASIISVGLAVQREMEVESPDFEFLINVNDNIAAGLAAQQSR